jgi:hypothetical protein
VMTAPLYGSVSMPHHDLGDRGRLQRLPVAHRVARAVALREHA